MALKLSLLSRDASASYLYGKKIINIDIELKSTKSQKDSFSRTSTDVS